MICPLKVLRKEPLLRHIDRHSDTLHDFLCGTCGQEYNSKANLTTHEKVHLDRSQWLKCNKCDYTTHSKGTMKIHNRTHTLQKLCKCEHCPKDYRTRIGITNHKKVSHDPNSIIYSDCNFSSVFAAFLEKHKKTHLNG